MTAPFVIVGGDAAGMSAASKCKRAAPEQEIVVFEQGEWVSYGACGLPYYIKGEIATLEELVSVTPEEFVEERGIDLRTGHEVMAVDTANQSVTVVGPDGEFEQPYSDLLIATGADAVAPPLDGMDLDGVFTLHSMTEASELRRYLGGETPAVTQPALGYGGIADEYAEAEHPNAVAIVGGGYVGIEMAEAFSAHDLEVHLFEVLPHTLQPFGTEAASVVEDHLREQGVKLHLETPVDAILGDDHVEAVAAASTRVPVDLVLVGVGVAPETKLATEAGIETGPTGAIATDDYGRTNDGHVYAAGDCAESTHVVTGDPDHVPLALTANRAGRAVGQTVAGDPTQVGKTAGTAAVKAFDLAVARTGLLDTERARDAGFDPVSSTVTTRSRAHYYPDGADIQITMLGDRKSGRVLGASMVGREGVAKRIDTVAAALHTELTARQLSSLDLAYAPPFSPVWDPVLTAAKVLDGKIDGTDD
jgi:NADPH-dependent 2,4-dienoyl-CoA reductase/sulfur reductase-like enzyme